MSDKLTHQEKFNASLQEGFNGDVDALWKYTLGATRSTLTFTDLVEGTDSSFDKALKDELGGDEQAMRRAVFGKVEKQTCR